MRHKPNPSIPHITKTLAFLETLDREELINELLAGRRCSYGECPIARYIHKKTGCYVNVSEEDYLWVLPSKQKVPMGEKLCKFRYDFDEKLVPELVEEVR